MNSINSLNADTLTTNNTQTNTLYSTFVNVPGHLTVTGTTEMYYTSIANSVFTDSITLGSRTFNVEQLGQLLELLFAKHPELSL